MKVLFLDFDGVITTLRAHIAFREKAIITRPDPIAVLLIDRICEETGAKIVVSSTWRYKTDKNGLTCFLVGHGINPEHLFQTDFYTPQHPNYIHKTDGSPQTKRGEEIQLWLNRNPKTTNYVIVDDESDVLEEQKSHLIRTDTYEGLSYSNYQECLRILGKKEQ